MSYCRTLVLLISLAACGGVNPSADDVVGDDDVPDVDAMPPDPPGECAADGEACTVDGLDGLCAAGSCGTCDGPADDAACAAAYGDGHLCIAGACLTAECRSDADCAAGETCGDDLTCHGCDSDDDCAAGEVCNVGTGACASADAVCDPAEEGQACGPGFPGHTCCGGSCEDIDECVVDPGCPAPQLGVYHVDPDSTAAGENGSAACPFTSLRRAFARVRSDGTHDTQQVEVVLHGTTTPADEGDGSFPLSIPKNVILRGESNEARGHVQAPADTTAFEIAYGPGVRVRWLEIRQPEGGGAAGAALKLTAPATIDHVYLHGFHNGINVGEGGVATINWGVFAEDNRNGLYVGGGAARVTVGAAGDRTIFRGNVDGIRVTAGELVLLGAQAEDGSRTIVASENREFGIWLTSADQDNRIDTVGVNDNGRSGLYAGGGSRLTVRGSAFARNGRDGVRAAPNGDQTSLDGIDLGDFDTQIGNNVFVDNAGAGVCAISADNFSVLRAEGNVFAGVSCAVPGGALSSAGSCGDTGVDVATNASYALSVEACSF
jgi:hypothetical protein